ncbi:unnamed protein product [Linum tenue]|uniref:Uncharacterized protein n=1 Tax=Linum tenue TaxID=586396 RepID=A0AAV0P147_9ROSI|nr:unnamed protein product [Linum tenue]
MRRRQHEAKRKEMVTLGNGNVGGDGKNVGVGDVVGRRAAVSVFAYQRRRMSGAFAVYLPRHQNGCQRIALLLQFLFLLLLSS